MERPCSEGKCVANSMHSMATQRLAKELGDRIMTRLFLLYGLRAIAIWGFAAGTILCGTRFALGGVSLFVLAAGLAGLFIGLALAGLLAWRRGLTRAQLLALLDAGNPTGGLLSAIGEEGLAPGGWESPHIEFPRVACCWRPAAGPALAAVVFFVGCAWLPLPQSRLMERHRLDAQQAVDQVKDMIQGLEEGGLLKDEDAAHWREELDQLAKQASGTEPAKTWESLDYMKESLEQKTEEALKEAEAFGQTLQMAEAAAAGLQALAEAGKLTAGQQSEAAEALQNALENAAQATGQELPEDLKKALAGMKGLSLTPEQMRKLREALQHASTGQRADLEALKRAKLLTQEELDQWLETMSSGCKGGSCTNAAALALALAELGQCGKDLAGGDPSSCTSGLPGKGGVSRGRGDAALTWSGTTQPGNEKFKAEALPKASLQDLAHAKPIGVSYGAAEEKGNATVSAGALGGAVAGISEARGHTVLPRHRGTVERYFGRGQKQSK